MNNKHYHWRCVYTNSVKLVPSSDEMEADSHGEEGDDLSDCCGEDDAKDGGANMQGEYMRLREIRKGSQVAGFTLFLENYAQSIKCAPHA